MLVTQDGLFSGHDTLKYSRGPACTRTGAWRGSSPSGVGWAGLVQSPTPSPQKGECPPQG